MPTTSMLDTRNISFKTWSIQKTGSAHSPVQVPHLGSVVVLESRCRPNARTPAQTRIHASAMDVACHAGSTHDVNAGGHVWRD